MAVPSIADLRAKFPEFGTTSTNGASDALIQLAIDHAAQLCDATVYGDQHTQAVLLEAADDLARSPYARAMALVGKDGSTSYEKRARRLMRSAAIGIRAL